MSEPLTINALASLHELMLSMLKEAEANNWQTLNQLDQRRRELLDPQNTSASTDPNVSVSNTNSAKQDINAYNSWCEKILKLDETITETVKIAKQQLVKENRNMRNQVMAKKGYAQNANSQSSF